MDGLPLAVGTGRCRDGSSSVRPDNSRSAVSGGGSVARVATISAAQWCPTSTWQPQRRRGPGHRVPASPGEPRRRRGRPDSLGHRRSAARRPATVSRNGVRVSGGPSRLPQAEAKRRRWRVVVQSGADRGLLLLGPSDTPLLRTTREKLVAARHIATDVLEDRHSTASPVPANSSPVGTVPGIAIGGAPSRLRSASSDRLPDRPGVAE